MHSEYNHACDLTSSDVASRDYSFSDHVKFHSSMRVDGAHEFSHATIKSQRAIARTIAFVHRNCMPVCETQASMPSSWRAGDASRKLINIFVKSEYAFCLSIRSNSRARPRTRSIARLCAHLYAFKSICVRLSVHVTWNKW